MELSPLMLASTVVVILLLVVIGCIAFAVRARKTQASLNVENIQLTQRLDRELQQGVTYLKQQEMFQVELASYQKRMHDTELMLERSQTENEGHQQTITRYQDRERKCETEIQDLRAALDKVKRDLSEQQSGFAELKASHSEREVKYKEQLELLEQNKAQMAK